MPHILRPEQGKGKGRVPREAVFSEDFQDRTHAIGILIEPAVVFHQETKRKSERS